MRILPKEIEIDPNDPFKNDVLGKKEYAVQLMNLVGQVEEPLVLAINAPWGEGKTTFVKMWQALLEQEGFKTIFFDAFANDYFYDPFLAVVGEIYALFEKLFTNKKDKAKLEDFKNRASQAAASLLSVGLNVGTKYVTHGLSDFSDVKKVYKSIFNKEKSTKALANKISSFKSEQETVVDFRKVLAEIAEEAKCQTGKPLIFIIDELDRCKPTYALDMIEKIKHLFSVKGIVFVLVLNKEQLEKVIQGVYGLESDASTYLQKFISVECTLPKKEERGAQYPRFCKKLMAEFKIVSSFPSFAFDVLAEALSLSLRDMQRWFSLINLMQASNIDYAPPPNFLPFLSALKVKNPIIFEKLKVGDYNDPDLDKYLQDLLSRISDQETKAFITDISTNIGHYTKEITRTCKSLEFFSIPAPKVKPE
ncbi:P-loop NTPase fold protein [Gemmatimonadota bacterium]